MNDVERWIPYHRFRPEARLRLLCFPHAGGGAANYRDWSQRLPPQVEVWPVQLPGRETRFNESPYREMATLLEALDKALRPSLLNRPFAIFGHSLGALIGFEFARRLCRYGQGPIHLFVSAFRAPQLPPTLPPMHHLPPPRFLAEVKKLGTIPTAVWENGELVELIAPTLQADFTLYEGYEYAAGEPLTCPISVYGGTNDPLVSEEQLEPWCTQTIEPCSQTMFEGDHFYLQERRTTVLQTLSDDLSQTMAALEMNQL